jgi:hypothetical protein
LPLEIDRGALKVASAELPDQATTAALKRFSSLEIRWCLLPPMQIDRLRRCCAVRNGSVKTVPQ